MNNSAIIVQNDQKLPRGIRLHKSGKYLVDLCVAGKRKTRTFETLDEAKAGRVEMTNSFDREVINQATTSSDNDWTLQYAIKKTFQLVWEGKGSEKTNEFNSASAVKFFGPNYKIKNITLDKIDDYVEYLLNTGNSGSTVNRKLSCLSRILRTGLDRGKLKSLPKMPRRREGSHRIRFLARDEEERMLKFVGHIGYLDHKDAIMMLIYTGFRCSELWRLERRDVDLAHGTITAWKTKNGHPRTIPIVAKVRPILEKRMAAAESDNSQLFPMASNAWLRQVWDKIRFHMNMDNDPQFVPHMLRHTCATRLAQKGLSMIVIKEWMGHSDIQTTSRYTHFAPKDLLNAAMLLNE